MLNKGRPTWSFWRIALGAFAPLLLLAACGGGGDGGNGGPVGVSVVANVLPVYVDSGPAGSGGNVNRLYTTITVCQPGSDSQCQTIDHVLVDTGSAGLRILASAVQPDLVFAKVAAPSGQALLNCAQFVDQSFAWGPVVTADVKLAGRTASALPVQLIADPAVASLAGNCSSTGSAITTVAGLGAKAILGVNLFKEDCGNSCVVIPRVGSYFACRNQACTSVIPTVAPLGKQLKNPVPVFAADNNGFLIDLPSSGNAARLDGNLIFGIGTQTNNQLGAAKLLSVNSQGYFTTQLAGSNLGASFIDSGSNGLFFDSPSLPLCSPGSVSGFYCPGAPVDVAANLVGANAANLPVSFTVDNAVTAFASGTNAVLPSLAGNIGRTNLFDWGLPFFFGRRLFFGIEGQTTPMGIGPFYAF